MTTVIASTTHIYQIHNNLNIDYGATPDRMNSGVMLKCIQLENSISDDGKGTRFDFVDPIRIDVFVRDNRARAYRTEPQSLMRLKKELADFIHQNKYSLTEDGISTMVLKSMSMREVDEEEYGLSNYYKLEIMVEVTYRMKYDLV